MMREKVQQCPYNFLEWLRNLRASRTAATGREAGNPLDDSDLPPHGAKFDVPERLAAHYKNYFIGDQYMAQMVRADWQQTDRAIQEFAARFVLEMRRRDIPVYVNEAFRTVERQKELSGAGFSKLDSARAPHVQGAAVDIVHSRYFWDLTDAEWAYMGKVGKEIARKMGLRIEWGGDWKFYDPAHWQLSGWAVDWRHDVTAGDPIRKTPSRIKKEGYQYSAGYTGRRSAS